MDIEKTQADRADARLGDIANRSEKGSAMRLIQAETKANNDKTARLRELRLQRDAELAKAAPAPKPATVRKSRKTAAAAAASATA